MVNDLKPKMVRSGKSKAKKSQAVSGRGAKRKEAGETTKLLYKLIIFLWRPKLLLSMIVAGGILTAYYNVNLHDFLPIETVEIEGEFKFLNKQQLLSHTLPVTKGGFFNVSLSQIRDTLADLAWVEDVSVRREWPDKLLVRVIEKKPVVLWGKKGIVSNKGDLFKPEKMPELKLPHLIGPQGQHKNMLQTLARMQAWLLETDLRIVNVELNPRRSWTLTLQSGMELRLGRKQIQERLNRFVSVYEGTLKIDKRDINYIDMRYTNGFSVAWKKA